MRYLLALLLVAIPATAYSGTIHGLDYVVTQGTAIVVECDRHEPGDFPDIDWNYNGGDDQRLARTSQALNNGIWYSPDFPNGGGAYRGAAISDGPSVASGRGVFRYLGANGQWQQVVIRMRVDPSRELETLSPIDNVDYQFPDPRAAGEWIHQLNCQKTVELPGGQTGVVPYYGAHMVPYDYNPTPTTFEIQEMSTVDVPALFGMMSYDDAYASTAAGAAALNSGSASNPYGPNSVEGQKYAWDNMQTIMRLMETGPIEPVPGEEATVSVRLDEFGDYVWLTEWVILGPILGDWAAAAEIGPSSWNDDMDAAVGNFESYMTITDDPQGLFEAESVSVEPTSWSGAKDYFHPRHNRWR